MKLKQKVLFLWLAFYGGFAFGQYDDTAVWRTHKVKEIASWVYFLQFENSDDTCLFELKQINQKGLITYSKQNYNCHGWNMIAETRFLYDDLDRLNYISVTQNDAVVSNTKLWYDNDGRVIKEESKYFEPYLISIITHTYFGSVLQPDSMFTVQVNNGDSTLLRTVYAYDKGLQTRAEVLDLTRLKPVSKRVNKYDNRGNLTRDEFIMMQSYEDDEIIVMEYTDDNRIKKSQSEINKSAAEFWYQGGLLRQTFYYNKFETLERKVFHKYKFWE